MLNLLPQKEQNNLSHEYRLRLVAAALLLLGLLGTLALGALAPSFFLSRQKELAVAKSYKALNQGNTLESKNKLAEVLLGAGNEVKIIKAINSTSPTYELIAGIVQAKTKSIKISGLHVTRNQDGSRNIALTGQARDKASLLAFAGILEQEKDFTKVTVPASNFIKTENINYSIMIDAK